MVDYHVSRDGKVLGVYPEERTRQYFSEGRIGPNDMVWREGMAQWLPAPQVLGVPEDVPLPPKLHWALVLLFGVLTLGIFMLVWMFIQSKWVRKIDRTSRATNYFIAYLLAYFAGEIMSSTEPSNVAWKVLGGIAVIASFVCFYVGAYSMRRSMLDYYNKVEPIGLRMSGAMTFFFSELYLQYHLTRIARWKMTGQIDPQ
jgi:hypothetical protein